MLNSDGIVENGIIAGNYYNKYNSRNPLVKKILKGFEQALMELTDTVNPKTIHEIGCGEGYWTLRWLEQGRQARGSDFSSQVIELARQNALNKALSPDFFAVKDIYQLQADQDSADLIICCEVLEHLINPEQGLEVLQKIVNKYLVVSVPREPIWCFLNLLRGKYLNDWGNTPGHLQHWSKQSFVKFISNYFQVLELKNPLPWTMLLCKAYE